MRQHRTDCDGSNCDRSCPVMRAPSGVYPGEHAWILGAKSDVRFKATGEYRTPKRGEFYLSGAIISAYRALNDLDSPYWIAVAGKITTRTTVTWEALTVIR